MFHSVPRRPIYEIGVNAMRLQSSRSVGSTVEEGMEKLQRFPRLGRNLGLLLSRIQRAGVGSKRASGQKKKKGLWSIFADHCGFVTGQRLRRACQVGEFYSNLYSERTRWTLFGNIWAMFQNNLAPTGKLVAALAGVFLWEKEKIQDEEMYRCGLELEAMEAVKKLFTTTSNKTAACQESGWEAVVDKKEVKVWRRNIPDTQVYEYRVLGSYNDVTPRQFFNVQLDTDYRKTWDSLVIKLEVVDRDGNTGSEVLHWATRFPYPLYSRDYVYVRRYEVDEEKNMMVLVSRAVEHPRVPETQEFVRVRSYQSKLVIRAHTSFDENGFDYLLTYSDDPQTVFPRYCMSWMVSTGMPEFLKKLHTAALRAKNLEIGIHDYTGVIKSSKSSESSRQPSQECLGAENTHTGGPGHIYA